MITNNSMEEFYRILSVSIGKHIINSSEPVTEIDSIKNCCPAEFDFNSSINITGSYEGNLYLFASKESVDHIFRLIYSSDLPSLEKEGLVQDSLDEFLNLIIANSTNRFLETNLPIHVGVPLQRNIYSAASILSDPENGCIIDTHFGKILLTFINNNN